MLNNEKKMKKRTVLQMSEFMADSFRPNIKGINFEYQNHFRSQSILLLYIREFVMAALIVIFFFIINHFYLTEFSERAIYKRPEDYYVNIYIQDR